ncbi:MAG: type IV toxin-antitoxin system AbiEi family antitoxin domain-containing protein [Alphaproteobacteria bacterium]|nr:type IV toxin-antitoxin system AbiEi family antitoxin domain-containing protein [Alphaproteobacteria bacterium]
MLDSTPLTERALEIARRHGIARARDFRSEGIPASYLSRLCRQGRLVRLSRGLYQVAEADTIDAAHDLAEIAKRVPKGVICLLSALRFHGLTTQLPHAVWLAIEHKARVPRVAEIRCEIIRASGEALTAGRMVTHIEGVEVRLTDPAKTIVDCFKYRRRVGLDVAIEALRDALKKRKATRADIWRYAEICRVQNVMRPYMEALT